MKQISQVDYCRSEAIGTHGGLLEDSILHSNFSIIKQFKNKRVRNGSSSLHTTSLCNITHIESSTTLFSLSLRKANTNPLLLKFKKLKARPRMKKERKKEKKTD